MREDKRTGTLYWLPNILADETLDAASTLIMLGLANHVDEHDDCFVGIERLAKQARVSYATARRRLSDLETMGRIQRSRIRRGDGNLSVYSYHLNRQPALSVSDGLEVSLSGDQRSPGRAVTSAHHGERAEQPRVEQPRVEVVRDLASDLDLARRRPAPATAFDEFWTVYPVPTAKQDARKAWFAALKLAPAEVIIAGAVRYRDDPHRDDDFTRTPAKWLAGGCWEDEPRGPKRPRAVNRMQSWGQGEPA